MKQEMNSAGLQFAVRSTASPIEGARAENEDNYLTIDADGQMEYLHQQRRVRQQLGGWPRGHRRFAVLDGVGGHDHGREMAECVVAGLAALPAFTDQASLNAALDALHGVVQARFADAPAAPGTTLLLLELPAHGPGLLYHVGDSRLYRLGDAGLEVLTVDHSPPTAFMLKGLLDEAAWRQQVLGEDRHAISQAFGLGSALLNPGALTPELTPLGSGALPPFLRHLADRRAVALRPDTVYLLATDGLWSFKAPLAFLASVAELIGAAAGIGLAELADQILLRHYRASHSERHVDNTTFIVLRTGKGTMQGA